MEDAQMVHLPAFDHRELLALLRQICTSVIQQTTVYDPSGITRNGSYVDTLVPG